MELGTLGLEFGTSLPEHAEKGGAALICVETSKISADAFSPVLKAVEVIVPERFRAGRWYISFVLTLPDGEGPVVVHGTRPCQHSR